MLGHVPADQVAEVGAQTQPVQHAGGEPPQQHAFLQANGVGITAPETCVDLDGDGESVEACRLLHGVRRQVRDFQAGCFLAELPPNRRLQAAVTHFAAAAHERECPWLPNAVTLIPQMQQIATVPVMDQNGCVEG